MMPNDSRLVLNIPENYKDGTHDIITFWESWEGKEGVVLGATLDGGLLSDWRGQVKFERKEKFTATFSAVSDIGYEVKMASMEFNSYRK